MKKQCVIFLIIAAICIVGAWSVLAIWLFKPIKYHLPSVEQYRDSEYYEIIEKLNPIIYSKETKYKNNFEKYKGKIKLFGVISLPVSHNCERETLPILGVSSEKYEENTAELGEVVIQADKIKHNDKYIFHMNEDTINIYSIDKENSKILGVYSYGNENSTVYNTEFYVSNDGNTLVLVSSFYQGEKIVEIKAIDISEPTQISEKKTIYIKGECIASRYVNDEILIVSNYYVNDVDFSDARTFIPQVNTGEGYKCIPVSNIIIPKNITENVYTTITKFNISLLELSNMQAYLSYSKNVYINNENVYLLRDYIESGKTKTDINAFSYEGKKIVRSGVITLDGSIENENGFDEYNGTLRIFTSDKTEGKVLLYGIDLLSFNIVLETDEFTSWIKTSELVEFYKNEAYLFLDKKYKGPILVLDLSDINNIVYEETTPLRNTWCDGLDFGDGYTLKIGHDSNRLVTVAVYKENDITMEPICKYTQDKGFVNVRDVRSYYINKDKKIVGLSIENVDERYFEYVVLKFDDGQLVELMREKIDGNEDYQRGMLIDDYFYIFGEKDFMVNKIEY